MHTFKIHAPMNPRATTVEVDGKPLEGVTRIEFSIAAEKVTEIKLTILGCIEVAGELSEAEIIHVERPEPK
jgi:hypothetical protein